MAEGVGVEPTSLSRANHGLASRCNAVLPAFRDEWCGREESNLQTARSERAAYASSATPAWWRGEESNLRRLPLGCRVYSPVLSPLSDLSVSGVRGGSRTHTVKLLGLVALPVGRLGPTVVDRTGVEPVLNHVLSMGPLPAWASGPLNCWRRVEDSNLHDREAVCFQDRGDTSSATTLRRSRSQERNSEYRDCKRRLIIVG